MDREPFFPRKKETSPVLKLRYPTLGDTLYRGGRAKEVVLIFDTDDRQPYCIKKENHAVEAFSIS